MRITSKGQVTIPQELRRRAGLMPLTEVEFELDGKGVRIKPAPRKKGARPHPTWIERMKDRGDSGLTTDEILALTRAE